MSLSANPAAAEDQKVRKQNCLIAAKAIQSLLLPSGASEAEAVVINDSLFQAMIPWLHF